MEPRVRPVLPPPRRGRARKIFLILLASIALAALGTWIGVLVHASRKASAMERGVKDLIGEAAAVDGRRPVALGEGGPGNAWDEYVPALEEIAEKPIRAPGNLKMFIGRQRGTDRAQVEAELKAHEAGLEHLSRGAHKAECRPPFRWDGESILPRSGDSALRQLAELAICRSRLLREAGDGAASLHLLLETAQMGRDAAANSSTEFEWEGFQSLELVFEELTGLILSKSFKEDDLALVERALETLDRSFPRDGRPFLNDVAYLGSWLLRQDPFLEANETYRKRRPLIPGWRHAFSMKLFKADAFERWVSAAREHAASGNVAWDRARTVFERNTNLMEAPPENLILNRLPPPSLEVNRTREARLALLLLAVHFLRTGEALSHADPFGSTAAGLRTEVDGRFFRAWSRGPNGADEGGGEAARPKNSGGSTTIIGPALGEADDIGISVER